MLHGDIEYYYDLAVRHDPIVHAFVAYSRRMYDELLARLPHRADTIFHLPYGIPLPAARAAVRPPVRCASIYGGRFEQQQKGVFDLPEIDRALQASGRHGGVDGRRHRARRRRAEAAVGVQPGRPLDGHADQRRAASDLYAQQDVFVLPTRFEGFPVALVEAMARRPAGDRQRHSRAACPRSSTIGSTASDRRSATSRVRRAPSRVSIAIAIVSRR